MKICIDISQIVFEGTGVANYTTNLVRELLRINNQTKAHQYLLFGTSLRKKSVLDAFALDLRRSGLNFKTSFWLLPPAFTSNLWNGIHHVKIERLTGKIDVFHSSDWTQPPTRAKKVTTIHDLVVFKYPESSRAKAGFSLKQFAPTPNIVENQKNRLAWIKKEANAVIAVSENTKKDIVELLGISKSKVHVVYEGVGADFLTYKPEKNNLGSYVLAMAGVGNRKNTDRIVAAFETLKSKTTKLNIIGKNLGFVSQKDLPNLYAHAEVFVYPSLYEGFGLPPLEALTVGCPVILSNTSSLPEVGGKAALYVDPLSVEDLAAKISDVLSWSKAKRQDVVAKGKVQASKFSWEKAAKETLKVYESL